MSAERILATPKQEESLEQIRKAHSAMNQATARRRSKVKAAREEAECTWSMIADQLDMTPEGAAKILAPKNLK